MMKVIGARWTEKVNILKLRCDCGVEFEHPANRKWAECPACKKGVDTLGLKAKQRTTW